MRVLVVDDSEIVRERITSILSKLEGVENIGVATGSVEAISLLDDLKPDMAILDVHLPGGSGIKTLRHIKRHHPDTKVIMLADTSLPQYRKICFENGADFLFDKSTDFRKVVGVIAQACKKTREGYDPQ